MVVVHGVEHVILDMPAKAGEHHANVHPRHNHAGNVLLDVTKHRAVGAVQFGQVVQVPAMFCIGAVTGPLQSHGTGFSQLLV